MSAAAFPLCWPPTMPRAKAREKGQFRTTYDAALRNVTGSLLAFGRDSNRRIVNPVLSTNVDMLGRNETGDPGVAVWFTWDDLSVCIAVDRYTSPAANLQAIHHVLEARRVELRHGTLHLVRASMTGFVALPAPKHWSEILAVPRTAGRPEIEAAFKRLAQAHHPDKGGSAAKMAELNEARAAALKEVP